jgi:hypothetical protein
VGQCHRWCPVRNGSVWVNRNGNRYSPYLDNWGDKRKLNLNWIDNKWNDNCRFAAVRNFLLNS